MPEFSTAADYVTLGLVAFIALRPFIARLKNPWAKRLTLPTPPPQHAEGHRWLDPPLDIANETGFYFRYVCEECQSHVDVRK